VIDLFYRQVFTRMLAEACEQVSVARIPKTEADTRIRELAANVACGRTPTTSIHNTPEKWGGAMPSTYALGVNNCPAAPIDSAHALRRIASSGRSCADQARLVRSARPANRCQSPGGCRSRPITASANGTASAAVTQPRCAPVEDSRQRRGVATTGSRSARRTRAERNIITAGV
jgi:hypothetical protein